MANPSMAITNLVPVKQEHQSQPPPPIPPPQQPPKPQQLVKSEPVELPPLAHSHQLQPQPQPQQQQQQQPERHPPQQQEPQPQQLKEPQFLKSIKDLDNLSVAIKTFIRRYDELQNHLDFIQTAIDSRSNELASQPPPPQPQRPQIQTDTAPSPKTALALTILTQKEKQPETVPKSPLAAVTKSPEVVAKERETVTNQTKTPTPSNDPTSELRSLCETTIGKGLRRYIIHNMGNLPKLREEVPPAMKLCPKPARLVLDCIGRFYLQGIKAYTKDSPMVLAREASVMCLELFLLMIDGNEVALDADVKQEAEQAAVAWRKRLNVEGGLSRASEVDARGLLFLVGCYGIPNVFSDQDVWDLVQSSNSKQISGPLRKSSVLVSRVSGMMQRMLKSGMKLEAVDVASTFGIESKFSPQTILSSFLHEATEALKTRKKLANNLPIKLKEANLKHFDALKSVMKFLEDRKLDPAEIIPGWQVKEKVIMLGKEIADLNKTKHDKTLKRKANDVHSSNSHSSHETKHQRFLGKGSPLITSSGIGHYDHRVAAYADEMSLYSCSTRVQLLDGGSSGHLNNYPASTTAPYGSVIGSLPENVIGSVVAGGGVMHTSGVGLSSVYSTSSAASSAGVGRPAAYDVPPTGSSAGVHREMLVDRAGQVIGNHSHPYSWHGSFNDGSLGQSFVQQPAAGLYRSSLSTERFVGLVNTSATAAATRTSASDLYGFVDQTSGSDLYGFADAVVEGSYNSSNRKAGALPSVTHHSSLY